MRCMYEGNGQQLTVRDDKNPKWLLFVRLSTGLLVT